MRNVAIIGFGVLGKQVLNFIKESIAVKTVIAFDDHTSDDALVNSVFSLNKFSKPDFSDFDFYIGIGYKHLHFRKELIKQLKNSGRNVPSLIHPSCYVSPRAKISDACIFFPRCNIDQNVVIDDGNIFHNSVTISHDVQIGQCNYFSPSVTLCGSVKLANEIFIGAGAVISNNVTVRQSSIIGIGSCITKDVEANTSVIGNPQKLTNKKIKLV